MWLSKSLSLLALMEHVRARTWECMAFSKRDHSVYVCAFVRPKILISLMRWARTGDKAPIHCQSAYINVKERLLISKFLLVALFLPGLLGWAAYGIDGANLKLVKLLSLHHRFGHKLISLKLRNRLERCALYTFPSQCDCLLPCVRNEHIWRMVSADLCASWSETLVYPAWPKTSWWLPMCAKHTDEMVSVFKSNLIFRMLGWLTHATFETSLLGEEQHMFLGVGGLHPVLLEEWYVRGFQALVIPPINTALCFECFKAVLQESESPHQLAARSLARSVNYERMDPLSQSDANKFDWEFQYRISLIIKNHLQAWRRTVGVWVH